MDEFRKNTEQDASEQTTPFQTPVRGADEQPGAGYQNAGASYTHTNDTADSSGFSDAGNGGSTPPPHSNAYEQWSGGKKPSGPKGPKGPKKKFPWKPVAAVVIVGALAFGGGWAANGHITLPTLNSSSDSSADTGSGTSANTTKVQLSSTSEDMASYSEVYQKVSPSIVAIVVDSVQQGTESSGSGVIMSEDGYIITNNHVVEGGDMYKVVLSDEKSYTAKLVGTDEQTDLAVLKIDATGLTAAEFGDSDNLKVGDRAFAIGSPGGLEYQNSFTGVNGKDITSMTDINEVKNELKVGDTMKLTIYRDGSTKEVSIKLIDQSTLSGTASSSGSDSSSSEDNSGGQSGSQNGGSTNPYGSYGYGYADNISNDEELGFDISWAVDAQGRPVRLGGVHFIKVYTAVNQDCGWIGETSTEVCGGEDLHPEAEYTPTGGVDGIAATTARPVILSAAGGTLRVRSAVSAQARIYSATGTAAALEQLQPGDNDIDISALPHGTYILHTAAGSAKFVCR